MYSKESSSRGPSTMSDVRLKNNMSKIGAREAHMTTAKE